MSYDKQFSADECAGCREYEQERVQLTARLAEAEARLRDLTTEREHMRVGLLCLSMRIVLQQYNLVFQDGDWWLMRSDGEGLVHAALLADLIIELGKKALMGGNRE